MSLSLARGTHIALWLVLTTAALGAAPLPLERKAHLAGLDVAVWEPQRSGAKSYPVVLFSHGLHGFSTSTRSLMQALALAGYWVIAPNHKDAVTNPKLYLHKKLPRKIRFDDPQRWTARTYGDRGDDIRRLLAALTAKDFPDLDRSKVALVGHSLGGYAVLCLAGARSDWAIKGNCVKAVVALSPYVRPLLSPGLLTRLKVPVMFQDGTLDRDSRRYVKNPQGAYDQVRAPKVYVEIEGGDHLSWTNLETDRGRHRLINRYAVAFLNHYVKGQKADPILTTRLSGISDLRNSSADMPFQADF